MKKKEDERVTEPGRRAALAFNMFVRRRPFLTHRLLPVPLTRMITTFPLNGPGHRVSWPLGAGGGCGLVIQIVDRLLVKTPPQPDYHRWKYHHEEYQLFLCTSFSAVKHILTYSMYTRPPRYRYRRPMGKTVNAIRCAHSAPTPIIKVVYPDTKKLNRS